MTKLGGICRPGSISLDVAWGRWGLISPAGTPVRFRISWCRARTVSINPEVPGSAWPIVAVGRRFVPGGEKSPAGFGVAMLIVSCRVRAWSPRGVVASVSHKDRDALFPWDSWGVAWPAHDMNQCPGSTRAHSRMPVAGNDQAITGLVTPVSHKDCDVSAVCGLIQNPLPFRERSSQQQNAFIFHQPRFCLLFCIVLFFLLLGCLASLFAKKRFARRVVKFWIGGTPPKSGSDREVGLADVPVVNSR